MTDANSGKDLTMKVGEGGVITWGEPRSAEPFMLRLFGIVGEKLFRLDAPEGQGAIAEANGENKTVRVEAGKYNIVGGQILAGINYLNLIEVDSDGKVLERKVAVDDIRHLRPGMN